ncbi:MAG TPA: hypothetical protein VGB89_13670 [Bacteroidota bacterium]
MDAIAFIFFGTIALFVLTFIGIVIFGVRQNIKDKRFLAALTPEQRKEWDWDNLNSRAKGLHMTCPRCGKKGNVVVRTPTYFAMKKEPRPRVKHTWVDDWAEMKRKRVAEKYGKGEINVSEPTHATCIKCHHTWEFYWDGEIK